MLVKDFRKVIAPSALLEIRSYHTDEKIKACKALELSEDDMNLRIDSIHASTYFNEEFKAYLGMFIIVVDEE